MNIDVATLFIIVILLCLLIGTIFVGAGSRRKADGIAFRGGAGLMLIATGLALVLARGNIPDWLSIIVANTLFLTGCGMVWSMARLFDRRPTSPLWIPAGAALWVAACAIPAFYASLSARIILVSLVAGGYALAMGIEFWRGRAERLPARLPLVVLCGVHASAMLLRVAAVLADPPTDPLGGSRFLNLAMLEAPLILIAGAFLMVALVRERAETALRREAETDELTGSFNRRAFIARASARLDQERGGAQPAVLLLFDLDRFKEINDRHGHAAGDRTLRLFSDTARAAVRSSDLFGRIGGEEFAAFLPNCDAVTAMRIAERIRIDFAAATAADFGAGSQATVSVGVSSKPASEAELDRMMSEADAALYRSKRDGRDRVTGSFLAVG